MKCPYCRNLITPGLYTVDLEFDSAAFWKLIRHRCPNPECDRFFFYLVKELYGRVPGRAIVRTGKFESFLVFPKTSAKEPAPQEVPAVFAEDYNEASLILGDSPKASAALSRRCLQHLLRDVEKVNPGKLADEIQQVLDRKSLPSHLAENIDAIRVIGNFAAHPTKSESTGDIVPVELGEAEWTLDTLEGLFDFYFVQPEKSRRKKESLAKKFAETKKPSVK
jgi:hypothetical protein